VLLTLKPLGSKSLATLLDIEEHQVIDCAYTLGTVLQYTEYLDIDGKTVHASNIRVLHKSVTDFLTSDDNDTNSQFSFKKDSVLAREMHGCLGTGSMNLLASQLSQELIKYLSHIDTSNLYSVSERRKIFDTIFNEDINYASLYWAEHMNESNVSNSIVK
ncbi:hypothetical protein HK100_003654, partial [Physocladia obscura]